MSRVDDNSPTKAALEVDSTRDNVESLKAALERAAELAVLNGLPAEVFSQWAVTAYAAKSPAFREQLETVQLAAQLEVLRAQGRLGLA